MNRSPASSWRRRAAAAAVLVLLQACAGLPGGEAPAWPARTVPLERMQPLERLSVAIPKHGRGGRFGGGTVVLRMLVDPAGTVQRVAVVEGSGDAAVDGAAARSMHGTRFAPFVEDGAAIPVTVWARMHFRAPPGGGGSVWP